MGRQGVEKKSPDHRVEITGNAGFIYVGSIFPITDNGASNLCRNHICICVYNAGDRALDEMTRIHMHVLIRRPGKGAGIK